MPQGKNKSDLDEIRSMGHSKPRKKAAQKKEPQEPLEPKKFRTYTKAELKSRLKEFIARRTSSRREVQTFSVMMVSSLLLILGMPLHFLNVVGSSAPFPHDHEHRYVVGGDCRLSGRHLQKRHQHSAPTICIFDIDIAVHLHQGDVVC